MSKGNVIMLEMNDRCTEKIAVNRKMNQKHHFTSEFHYMPTENSTSTDTRPTKKIRNDGSVLM